MLKIIKRVGKYIVFHLLPDSLYLKWKFKQKMGYPLNLKAPITLNEKIQWLKLYDRTELHTICADKVRVRQIIETKIGSKYLVPLIYWSSNIDDLSMEVLPDFPSIIKANHDSGTNFLVLEKNLVDLKTIKDKLETKLNQNYYYKSKEWQYKNISPAFMIEKLLLNKQGKTPYDYKVHCFNGNPRMIQVDLNRGSTQHRRNWYNTNWVREPYYWSSNINGVETVPADFDVPAPSTLNEMLELSAVLSETFKYVRIDWYDCDGRLYFGEITFHHDSGYRPIIPKDWDKNLGSLIQL